MKVRPLHENRIDDKEMVSPMWTESAVLKLEILPSYAWRVLER